MINPDKQKRTFALSKAEKELVHWICLGKTIPEAAMLMKKSPHTLKNQLKSVYGKLKIFSRIQLPAALLAQAPDINE